jgi:diguanylate cyclase (GGDEF)-like protein
MADRHVSAHGFAFLGATPPGEAAEADFESALLREQYRSLTRLSPYVHGIAIVAALACCAAATAGSLLPVWGIILPIAVIAFSMSRARAWIKARSRVEHEAFDVIGREVRLAGLLAPAMALTLSIMTAVYSWNAPPLEFVLALVAVWAAGAACSFCLSALANSARVVVTAGTFPLIVASLIRGSGLTLWLAALITIAACFVIRMLSENFRMFAEIVGSRIAIAEKQRAAEDATRAAMTIALTDDLTGLPNRRCFQGQLADRAGTEGGLPFAVGLIDLDGFKPINDIHGHPAGDDILRQVATRLARAIEGRCSAARMGGDEFAILCNGISAPDQARALGDEIQAIFAAPFVVNGLDIALTGACGFALFPSSASEPDELVRLSDAALYRAKATGRGGVVVFDPEGESNAVGRAAPEDALRRAVGESKIGVVLQPIVASTTGRISGFESFTRWNHAALGQIAPPPFITAASLIGATRFPSSDRTSWDRPQ